MNHVPFMYLSWASFFLLLIFYFPLCFLLVWVLKLIFRKIGLPNKVMVGFLTLISIGLFLIPTWYEIIGKYYLDKACEEEGGYYLNSDEVINGLYLGKNYRYKTSDSKYFLDKGFGFVEVYDYKESGCYNKYFYDKDKNVKVESGKERRANYFVSFEKGVFKRFFSMDIVFYSDRFIQSFETEEKITGYKSLYLKNRLSNLLDVTGHPGGGFRCTLIGKFNQLTRGRGWLEENGNRFYDLVNKGN